MSTILEQKPAIVQQLKIKPERIELPKVSFQPEKIISQHQKIQKELVKMQANITNIIESKMKANELLLTQLESELKTSIPEELKKMTTEEVEAKFNVAPKTLELQKGEVKELTDGMFVKKTKDGILKIYLVQE